MSSIDPATFAAQFAQIEIQPFKKRYQLQTNTYQSQLSALGKVESAMREFRT
ncbi:flagellar cap protein FliD N-terminal domain-containing protein, partial [Vibrio parahaemolyticus]